jgi:hypothetical protein
MKKIAVLVVLSVLLSSFVYADTKGDIDGDDKVGLAEAVNALQVASGLAVQYTRWSDQGDGTVKDMETGLVWLQKADWGGDLTYEDARTRAGILCAGANGANLSDGSVEGDWRIPTRKEIYRLANGNEPIRCTSYSCDDEHSFTGVGDQNDYYWTPLYSSSKLDAKWVVAMYPQRESRRKIANRTALLWPVRSDH